MGSLTMTEEEWAIYITKSNRYVAKRYEGNFGLITLHAGGKEAASSLAALFNQDLDDAKAARKQERGES